MVERGTALACRHRELLEHQEQRMDSAQFMAKCAKTDGLIDRLEALAANARAAYAADDKRMFHKWMGEYGPLWQQAQDSVTEIGETAVQSALRGDLQVDPNSSADMHEALTHRLVSHTNDMQAFMASVNRENPQFLIADSKTGSGGCYIATAVYGSYDAPEVAVLRAFRDQTLARSMWGRGFIRLYYRISPPLALRLGRTSSLNRIARSLLDPIVSRLH